MTVTRAFLKLAEGLFIIATGAAIGMTVTAPAGEKMTGVNFILICAISAIVCRVARPVDRG